MPDSEFFVESASAPLDLFSTSPTQEDFVLIPSPFERCAYHAPLFAFKREGARYGVVQGCCNHWECPRCGVLVAKRHYGRIVEGAREIARNNEIWFITVTCRGTELSEADATKNYLAWTSKLLDACYADAKRKGKDWFYVQVTEKQKRGHPHSHILTTWRPDDVYLGHVEKWETDASGARHADRVLALRSDWLQARVIASGLGEQYDLSKVETVEGAARYVAKYMFKKAQFEAHYPKRWKRVRYSQTWPDFTKPKTDAFVLLTRDDWRHLASLAAVVDVERGEALDQANYFLMHDDVVIHERKEQK